VRWLIAALLVAIALAGPAPAFADAHGVPLPRGTRAAGARYASGKGYRETVDHLRRWLARTGIAHRVIGPYRARGVDVTRFLSDDRATAWLAIHVYRQAGKTWISLVLRPS